MGERRGKFTARERRVRDATAQGHLLDLSDSGQRDREVPAALVERLLTDGEMANQPLKMRGARITGVLDLENAHLTRTLELYNCTFDSPVTLTAARAPAIRLSGCHVPSLHADRLTVERDLELDQGFTAAHIRIVEAHVGGSMSLNGAKLGGSDQWPVAAYGLTVDRSMWCGSGLTVNGDFVLVNASIGGTLSFTGAHLHSSEGHALNGQSLTIGRALFLGSTLSDSSGFTASGEVRLTGSRVAAFVCCWGARLHNPEGFALSALGIQVSTDLYLDRGFTAAGDIFLDSSSIGGSLHLDGATLRGHRSPVLTARHARIEKSLFCRDGFSANAPVDLSGLYVGGSADFTDARLDSCPNLALNYVRAQSLVLRPRNSSRSVDVRHAVVDVFEDDPQGWPTELLLMNFTYGHLENLVDLPAQDRLKWLRRDPTGYKPQPYEQLRAAYRRAGLEKAARRTAIAKHSHERSATGYAGKMWNWVLYATVGYGYRPWQAGVWLIGLLMAGTYVFAAAYPAEIIPTVAGETSFHPIAYTADILVPFLDLSQQSTWQPEGRAAAWSWGLTAAGWFLTTCVVAGLTRILRRE
ncbi:hypothetical protein [Actinophytocola sp. KF-1]